MENIVKEVLKRKSRLYVISSIIWISLILINTCLIMIMSNYSNMKSGLLDNSRLKLLQVFGQNNDTGDMNLDEDIIRSLRNVVFVEKTYPISIDLYDDKGQPFGNDQIFIYKLPKEYGEYVGMDGVLEDDTIYCPIDSISSDAAENASLTEEYRTLNLKIKVYNGTPPQMLEQDSFVNEKTYDKIMDAERKRLGKEDADLIYSTPQYLVGVDETVNVFDVVKRIKDSLPKYDIQIAYQASGLKDFVDNSVNMVYFQGFVAILVFIIALVIIYVFLSMYISRQEKNLMVIYINGLTRDSIINQLYRLIRGIMIKPCYIIMGIVSIGYIVLSFARTRTLSNLQFLFVIIVINIIVMVCDMVFLKFIIRRKINTRTSNANIISMIRN